MAVKGQLSRFDAAKVLNFELCQFHARARTNCSRFCTMSSEPQLSILRRLAHRAKSGEMLLSTMSNRAAFIPSRCWRSGIVYHLWPSDEALGYRLLQT